MTNQQKKIRDLNYQITLAYEELLDMGEVPLIIQRYVNRKSEDTVRGHSGGASC